jgi:hypothetical protein
MSGLFEFGGFVLDAEEKDGKVTNIPEQFWDVIVMAGHEL